MLIVGSTLVNITCELFIDIETKKRRVRPIEGEGIEGTVMVECLKKYRDFPIGTLFLAKELKVCQKDVGRIYLRAKDQLLYPLK